MHKLTVGKEYRQRQQANTGSLTSQISDDPVCRITSKQGEPVNPFTLQQTSQLLDRMENLGSAQRAFRCFNNWIREVPVRQHCDERAHVQVRKA
jgi:hypothetical protein